MNNHHNLIREVDEENESGSDTKKKEVSEWVKRKGEWNDNKFYEDANEKWAWLE